MNTENSAPPSNRVMGRLIRLGGLKYIRYICPDCGQQGDALYNSEGLNFLQCGTVVYQLSIPEDFTPKSAVSPPR